jgi:VanZ family protein
MFFSALAALHAAFIFWLSSRPFPEPSVWNVPGLDKIVHAMLYSILAVFIFGALYRGQGQLRLKYDFILPILWATLYGLSDEVHQLFVPTRSFDPLDVLADASGAVLGQWLLFRYFGWLPALSLAWRRKPSHDAGG